MRRTATFTILLVLLGVFAGSPQPADAGSTGQHTSLLSWRHQLEAHLLALTNDQRANAGRAPLTTSYQLSRHSRDHSATMSSQQSLHHDDLHQALSRVHPQGTARSMGENVGYRTVDTSHQQPLDVARALADAFWNSSGHRNNILGDWTHIGVGGIVEAPGQQRAWVTVRFLRADQARRNFPLFHDADSGPVRALYLAGITAGCDVERFCPAGTVSRAQMASFLTRAAQRDGVATDSYDDVHRTHPHGPSIGALEQAGWTAGCTERSFCPGSATSRGQMATFLLRMLGAAPLDGDWFEDADPTHGPSAERLHDRDIVEGCDTRRFCPAEPMRRDTMAVWLNNALPLPTRM